MWGKKIVSLYNKEKASNAFFFNLVLFNQLHMTEAKLLKYLRKDYIQPSGNKTITPVVLSDRKGFCL